MLLKKKFVLIHQFNLRMSSRYFSTVQEDDNDEEKIFVSQQQIDYEKERRFLRDGI